MESSVDLRISYFYGVKYIQLKRLIDLVCTLAVLVLLSPLLLLVCLLLFINNKGEILFTQERTGLQGHIFRIFKFKTMTDARDAAGKLLPDNDRLTPVGRLVRSSSLDELPQLLNVLRGEMSLIGPRPLLPKYLPLYSPEQNRRHAVRPGITGWAQVNGRNAISWSKKFEYDVWYVDHLGFAIDLKIFWLTIRKVLVREGINAGDSTTMQPFTGNN
jgi:undecaprenyl phosphate N,N'-diacetylbacillosamine 1-phosphate transferase